MYGDDGNPLLARLNPALGPLLRALPCDLIWATTWMQEANDVISPRLGLPALPVVAWSDSATGEDEALHWKTPDLVTFAAGRPFIWVDDEIAGADRAWVRVHHPGPALLHRVDRLTGVTEADVTAIANWLREY